MLTLDDTTKKELLTELVPAVQEATDVNRRAIKKIVRKIVATCFEDTERKTFHEYTGKTINNIIDMVNRETLLNLCVHAIGMPPYISGYPAFLFGTAVTQLAYAYKDDSLCRPCWTWQRRRPRLPQRDVGNGLSQDVDPRHVSGVAQRGSRGIVEAAIA